MDGATRTIEFLVRALGAEEIRRFPDASGRIRHSEVRIGDTVVMIADGAEGWPPIQAHVHVYVEDVDATFRLALEAGATAVQEPVKKDDTDKRGGVKDAGGTTWWIATRWSEGWDTKEPDLPPGEWTGIRGKLARPGGQVAGATQVVLRAEGGPPPGAAPRFRRMRGEHEPPRE